MGNQSANIIGGAVNPLGIGSLLSNDGVNLLTFGIFKLASSYWLEVIISLCHTCTPKKRRELKKQVRNSAKVDAVRRRKCNATYE
mmetsp:Transcript_1513/g.1859  ORF Transcript_1513/g.1859 Transcript_1513/m.1859 type:complete len:85 (+) Transcript_1513:2453-2707(+)